MTKIILFCIPHAGGGAHNYVLWQKFLPDFIKLIPIELSGHYSRANELLYSDFSSAVADVVKQIEANADLPFTIFGHSMGGALAYESALVFQKNQHKLLKHVFISSCIPPHLREKQLPYYELNDDAFKKYLIQNDVSEKTFDNVFFNELILPIIRADFKLFSSYHRVDIEPILYPISSFCGDLDQDHFKKILEWNLYSSLYSHNIFSGHHFYFLNNLSFFMKTLSYLLLLYC